jgi:heme exporter protein C
MRKLLDYGLPSVALALLVVGGYWGLFIAPTEREMGEVYRVIYVHVPAAWTALIAFTVTLIASVTYLMNGKWGADTLAEASAEVGVFFSVLVLITGSVWGKPTWGVYWSWDPRLTTAAIMTFGFAGYLALRRFVDLPERRAVWAAVVAVIIYVDIPLVWFSVKWWNSLHQLQSSPQTVSSEMVTPLRISAFAFLFAYLYFTRLRSTIGRRRLELELGELPEGSLAGGAR